MAHRPVGSRRSDTLAGFLAKVPAPWPYSSPHSVLSPMECTRWARATRSEGQCWIAVHVNFWSFFQFSILDLMGFNVIWIGFQNFGSVTTTFVRVSGIFVDISDRLWLGFLWIFLKCTNYFMLELLWLIAWPCHHIFCYLLRIVCSYSLVKRNWENEVYLSLLLLLFGIWLMGSADFSSLNSRICAWTVWMLENWCIVDN